MTDICVKYEEHYYPLTIDFDFPEYALFPLLELAEELEICSVYAAEEEINDDFIIELMMTNTNDLWVFMNEVKGDMKEAITFLYADEGVKKVIREEKIKEALR